MARMSSRGSAEGAPGTRLTHLCNTIARKTCAHHTNLSTLWADRQSRQGHEKAPRARSILQHKTLVWAPPDNDATPRCCWRFKSSKGDFYK